jgi:hypothetical protein
VIFSVKQRNLGEIMMKCYDNLISGWWNHVISFLQELSNIQINVTHNDPAWSVLGKPPGVGRGSPAANPHPTMSLFRYPRTPPRPFLTFPNPTFIHSMLIQPHLHPLVAHPTPPWTFFKN